MTEDNATGRLTRRELLRLLNAGAALGLLTPANPVDALAAQASARPGRGHGRGLAGGRREGPSERVERDRHPRHGFPQTGSRCCGGRRSGPATRGRPSSDGRVFVLDWVETQKPARHRARHGARREDRRRFCGPTNGRPTIAASRGPSVHARRRPSTATASTSLGADGKLFCLNAKTGAMVWQKDYRRGLQRRPHEVGLRLGIRQRAARRRRPRLIALVDGRPDAQGGRVRQDDRPGTLACAHHGHRSRRRPAGHHHRRRRAAVDHLVPGGGRVARSGDRQGLLGAALQGRRLDDGGAPDSGRPAAVLLDLL